MVLPDKYNVVGKQYKLGFLYWDINEYFDFVYCGEGMRHSKDNSFAH